MTEIKFRAWNKGICRMFSAEEMGKDELTINPDGRGFVNGNSASPKLSQYYPHMIPMQYTGLQDINGVDIYEGDILKDEHNHVLLVEAWKCRIVLRALTETTFVRADIIQWFEGDVVLPRIIGNIYENPELESRTYEVGAQTMSDYREIEITVNVVGKDNVMTAEKAKIEALRLHIAVSPLATIVEVMEEIKKRVLAIENAL